MELQNTVKEALNALYHHPDGAVHMQADRWLQDFQRTIDAWQAKLQSTVEMQQGEVGVSLRRRMEEIRLVCEREIPIQRNKIDASLVTYRNLLKSSNSKAQQTILLQGNLGALKVGLRESEDAMVKALAVKNQKEGKRITLIESLSVIKARVQELKGIVEDQRARKEEYAAIISQQSEALTACMEKLNTDKEHCEQVEEAISWYNNVLGFRIECGHGVKFIFTNIDPEKPSQEYFFSVRHENEIYTLLDCNPCLSGTKELVTELNKSNGLFKFVRTMRQKFQEAATHGISVHSSSKSQESSMISVSAPVASDSTNHHHHTHKEYPVKQKEVQNGVFNTTPRKVVKTQAVRSPGSASSLRRSARLKCPRIQL